MQLPQTDEFYLRSPRLEATSTGARLRLIAWDVERSSESVRTYTLDVDGKVVGEPEQGPQLARIVSLNHAHEPGTAADELEARDGTAHVRLTQNDGVMELVLTQPDPRGESRRTVVWRARGSAAAPAVASTPGGTWVVWHHDVREDSCTPDVAKWIDVRFVDLDGEVFQPTASMRGRDRDLAGEEQSFEFPAIVVSAAGALTICGRGSHNFWRQDLSSEGWTERVPLSDGNWGSRGRRPSVTTLPDGRLLVARRDRKAIEVDVLQPPSGGAPELMPATVGTVRVEAPRPTPRDPAARRGLKTYFGDIQQHSAHSDGVGSAEEAYLRARWRYGDDFVALTDHESFLGKRTGPGEWEYLQEVADAFDAPGEFATLLAYEWTGKRHPGPGHKCVYLPRRGMPIVSRDDLPEGRDLVQRIKELGGIASPHHIGWTGCDEDGHDPEGQPVWEICSCHGCYEHADHPLGMRGEHTDQLADVMLKKGHRFGFTASSDSHGLLWHHGESRKRDPYRTGLTAVQCTELTRDAIFEALRTRRCYGTSGAKIRLDVTVNDAPMGSEIRADELRVVANAVGESRVDRIELVTERGVVATAEAESEEVAIDTVVKGDFVYARVIQRDGEMAWSSPVFNG